MNYYEVILLKKYFSELPVLGILLLFTACISSKSIVVEQDTEVYEYVVEGTGKFTLVMESGLGDDMNTWAPIFNALAEMTRTFVYNRSGYGKSKGNSGKKDAETIARELYKLLKKTGIPGPYVLVGHSLGGQYSLAFAKQFPNEVAGLVLLDARHPEFTRLCKQNNSGNCEVPRVMYSLWGEHIKNEYDDAQMHNESQLEDLSFLKDIPLTVVARTKDKGIESKTFKTLWHKTQKDLAKSSEKSRFVELPNCGHYVHREAPSRVIGAIKESLEFSK